MIKTQSDFFCQPKQRISKSFIYKQNKFSDQKETYSESSETFKMELFAKIVKG